MPSDPTQRLKELMHAAGIASYRLLAERAGVSRWQIQQLRNGHIQKMRLVSLTQIAAALEISFIDLYAQFEYGQSKKRSLDTLESCPGSGLETSEADVLQTAALQTLESWLVQWPTIAKRAQDRLEFPAAKILPFVRPVEQLMSEWGVKPVATVDCQVAYNPTYHQLVAGFAEPGDLVRVTHAGVLHHGRLLHRAKVKPITSDS